MITIIIIQIIIITPNTKTAVLYTSFSIPSPLFQNSSQCALQNALQPPKYFILNPKVTHAAITIACALSHKTTYTQFTMN